MSKIYEQRATPYAVRNGFTKTFGEDPIWWLTFVFAFLLLFSLELFYRAFKRTLKVMGVLPLWKFWERFSNTQDHDIETWQELEQDKDIRARLQTLNR